MLFFIEMSTSGSQRSAEHAFFPRLIQPREADRRERLGSFVRCLRRENGALRGGYGRPATTDKFPYENSEFGPEREDRLSIHNLLDLAWIADRASTFILFQSSLVILVALKA